MKKGKKQGGLGGGEKHCGDKKVFLSPRNYGNQKPFSRHSHMVNEFTHHPTTLIKFNHHQIMAMYFGHHRWICWQIWLPYGNNKMVTKFGRSFFRVYEFLNAIHDSFFETLFSFGFCVFGYPLTTIVGNLG